MDNRCQRLHLAVDLGGCSSLGAVCIDLGWSRVYSAIAMWSRVVWNLWDEQQAWHYVFLCSRWQRLFLSHQICPECTATSRSGWLCCRGQPDDKQAVCKSQGWLWSWHGFFLTSLHMKNSWYVYGNARGIAEEWMSFTFGCGQLKLDWLCACGITST